VSRQRDARLTHDPRYSRIGPSLTFAIIAAPNRSTKNVNTTKSRQLHDMRPSPFPHTIRIDVTSSDALVTIYGIPSRVRTTRSRRASQATQALRSDVVPRAASRGGTLRCAMARHVLSVVEGMGTSNNVVSLR
jgi:hypothetical protein